MITHIKIYNFKSIKQLILDLEEENTVCLLGKNGAGKSNIFKALTVFFSNLDRNHTNDVWIDKINPYIQNCVISVTFNIKLLKNKARNNEKLEAEFEKISNYLKNGFKFEDKIELKMTQYKDGKIAWNVKNKDIRNTFKNVFPIYVVDTRQLDLISWSKLWDIINDLSVTVPQQNQEKIAEILDNTFAEIYGNKYNLSKKILLSTFQENSISLDKYHFNNKLANAFSMRFGGNKFLLGDKNLDFYSDGTNSFTYLKLLISLIAKISATSCKYPILLIDEPEIGLHNSYIRQFVASICKNINGQLKLIMATHSPKMISELASQSKKYVLYNISNIDSYSTIRRLNTEWIENNAIVSIKESECYFSDYLVYVEGESELQLFKNIRILSLFPKLSKIHFYSFDSNNIRLKNALSNKLNLGIKYKVIVDMDKILKYNNQNKKFKVNSDVLVNPLKDNEETCIDTYKYKQKLSGGYALLRKRISALTKLSFSPNGSANYIDNDDYFSLIESVREYCRYYNVLVNYTTIEGELITVANIDKFLLFIHESKLSSKVHINQHQKIIKKKDIIEKTVFVRCECNGKTDMQTSSELKYKKILGDKTGGWIANWLEFYFSKYIDILPEYIDRKKQFNIDFPSLSKTLRILESMVK